MTSDSDQPRIKLTIAYDGRPFAGWQIQRDRPSVQGRIEEALAKIAGGTRVTLHGSGRTDTGVHARGQVAHFNPPPASSLAAADWQRALNANLPPTIRVLRSELAGARFHARYDATGKTYIYRVVTGPVLPPLENGLAWHFHHRIDTDLLRETLLAYVGTHDFRGFAANRRDASDQRSGVRTIRRAAVAVQELPEISSGAKLFTLNFEGDGFLYHMVRLLVGSALRVATGRNPLQRLTDLRDRTDPTKSAHCAPAAGLTLHEVTYR